MERKEKRLDIAMEAARQQITLSAGMIAVMVALADPDGPMWPALPYILAPFAISVLAGAWLFLATPMALYDENDPLAKRPVRIPGTIQILSFVVGIVAMVVVTAVVG